MAVLERSELEASPLADLHAIANQIGLDGFRRLRKAELIDAILGEPGASAAAGESASGAGSDSGAASDADSGSDADAGEEDREPSGRRRRPSRSRRTKAVAEEDRE